jgi:hypothetical protein
VEGDVGLLAAYLRDHGASVETRGRYLRVEKDRDAILDWIRDGVVENDLGLVRLEQSRRRLEELFEDGAAEEVRPG